MKTFFKIILSLAILSVMTLFASTSSAVQSLKCTSPQDQSKVVFLFFQKDIDPAHPLIGRFSLGFDLKIVSQKGTNLYQRSNLRLISIKGTSDPNLMFDNENIGVYVRLYPQFISQTFDKYHAQIFINDISVKAYYNFSNSEYGPGLICHENP